MILDFDTVTLGDLDLTTALLRALAQNLFPHAVPLRYSNGVGFNDLTAGGDIELKRKVIAQAICMTYVHSTDRDSNAY